MPPVSQKYLPVGIVDTFYKIIILVAFEFQMRKSYPGLIMGALEVLLL